MPHPFDQVFVTQTANRGHTRLPENPGINLRTYLAAMAMQGLLSNPFDLDSFEDLADKAVANADALIERLNKRS